MCNLLMDGPADVEIDGDRVCVTGLSGGEKVCWTFRMEDALLTEHRFQAVKAEAMAMQCEVVPFPRPHAADSA